MGKLQSKLGFNEQQIEKQKTNYSSIEAVTNISNDISGNAFIHRLSELILDEWKIIGNGDFIKANHKLFIDFKYPEELEKMFDFTFRSEPESYENLMDMCKKTITHSIKSNHPHYMNSLYGGVDQFGISGGWLTESLNSSAALWESSPVFSIIEKHVIDFLGKCAGFHPLDGHFCPGGSMANGYAMMLARHRMCKDIKDSGLIGKSKMVIFISDMAHYSFRKMAIMLGHGTESVIKVKSDSNGCMIPEELERAIIKSKNDAQLPYMIAATSGTTVLGSFDPLDKIGKIAKKYQIWLHSDGAFGGTWLFSKTHRKLLEGLSEYCDSFTWDLHKMLSIPIYCSVILTKHPGLFNDAFNLKAEYLFQTEKYYNKTYDVGDSSIQCTRKVDVFKLYIFLKAHGLKRIEEYVDNTYNMSRFFEDQISKRSNFQLIRPRSFSQNICFHFIPDAYLNKELTPNQRSKICTELKRRIMENGSCMVAYQSIPEKNIPVCFRLTISCLPVYMKEDILHIVSQFELYGKDLILKE